LNPLKNTQYQLANTREWDGLGNVREQHLPEPDGAQGALGAELGQRLEQQTALVRRKKEAIGHAQLRLLALAAHVVPLKLIFIFFSKYFPLPTYANKSPRIGK
jgi:hypothetical protein